MKGYDTTKFRNKSFLLDKRLRYKTSLVVEASNLMKENRGNFKNKRNII